MKKDNDMLIFELINKYLKLKEEETKLDKEIEKIDLQLKLQEISLISKKKQVLGIDESR